ncbi:MAG: DNA repair protein RadA [Zetaproteobacteria bacterium]|nr:MAG: DNA repair protein RadA [Zetaproteobacteria bacterium]
MASSFVCQECGCLLRKWQGQCPDCGGWNTISEQPELPVAPRKGSGGGRRKEALAARPITEVGSEAHGRCATGIGELDRVLGGGLVPASAVLIGGAPGIGKSTLLLQAAALLARDGSVLYITGEESAAQVRLRAERIGALHDGLTIAAGVDLEAMLATISEARPQVVVVDSIQTATAATLGSAPGTVAQVRECAAALIRAAKSVGFALVLVGHVTKEGALAGPRVLEHMVDCVLYFEGDRGHAHRMLRAVKNRFGPAGEVGIFEMRDSGLKGVRDASRLFLHERSAETAGSVVLACMEGTRPLLVEVQALVAPTVYATPRRAAVGIDPNRVAMLMAILERRIGLPLAGQDVYLNVVGGVRIVEPASDLAVAMAVISAWRDQPLPAKLALFGEVGLTGEVRPVGQPEARLRELASLGFARVLLPQGNRARALQAAERMEAPPALLAAASLGEAVRLLGAGG